jgi:3,4-dihydroxy 2-butanone 4-phosphate synthase/GTP cyclohydrolase II
MKGRLEDGMSAIRPVADALADIAAGKPVVVVEEADTGIEGDVVFAAARATPELVAFMVRHTSGYVCVPLGAADCVRLDLPLISPGQGVSGPAFTVSVDARRGTSTGISASDRARTMRLLADPSATARDFTRPGHVVPVQASDGGVLSRPGRTEAAVDLARLAGLPPVSARCEIVSQWRLGEMADLEELSSFAHEHGLTLISVAQLVDYRRRTERQVDVVAQARIPTAHGEFRAVGYRSLVGGAEHVALVYGDVSDCDDVLVGLHSECLAGDVFGSCRCGCRRRLDAALEAVATEGRGVLLYLRGHEASGADLLHLAPSPALLAVGGDGTLGATGSHHRNDETDRSIGAEILADLGIRTARLLTQDLTGGAPAGSLDARVEPQSTSQAS